MERASVDQTDWLTGHGRILGPDEQPLRATIRIRLFRSIPQFGYFNERMIFHQTIETDESGAFSYRTPPNSIVKLWVSHTQGQFGTGQRSEILVSDARPANTEIRLRPRHMPQADSTVARRSVAIELVSEEGEPLPIETVVRLYLRHGDGLQQTIEDVAISNGHATITLRRGEEDEDAYVIIRELEATGWMLESFRPRRVSAPDSEAWKLRFAAVPAGAIYGVVRNADGERLEGMYVKAEEWRQNEYRSAGLASITDRNGGFLIYPVPMGSRIRLVASPMHPGIHRSRLDWVLGAEPMGNLDRHTLVISNDHIVSDLQRVVQVDLTVPRGQDIPLRVRDANGQPVADTPVMLQWHSNGEALVQNWARTDESGRALLEGVNREILDTLEITVPPGFNRPRTRAMIGLDYEELEVETPPSCTLRGELRDPRFGDPIVGATIQATPTDRDDLSPTMRTITDESGLFIFGNLENREYFLRVDDHVSEGTHYQIQPSGDERLVRTTALPRVTPTTESETFLKLLVIPRDEIPRVKP